MPSSPPRGAPPPPPPPKRPPPEAGSTYEGFELIERIGEGNFAWVFAAKSPAYEETVALKVSKDPVANESTALRALREIRILGSLSNSHVVHVFDHGLGKDERWYMVMELLSGESLTTKHDFDRPLSAREAVGIVHQLCLGLAEAHRVGIVHRDVKPDNVWLLPDGAVKLLDFGLARAWDTDSDIGANATIGHMLVGTPHYAQPEQVHSGKLTPASDVYSLGVLLYELLVGRTPFFEDESWSSVRDRLQSEPLGWLVAHVQNEVVPLDRYPEGATLPKALIEVVNRALAKNPAERFESAGALANALSHVLHEELGGAAMVTLEVSAKNVPTVRHALRPGVYRVGVGAGCEIKLMDHHTTIAFAVIEWAGPPRDAEMQPLITDGSVRVNGHVIDYRVFLVAGTQLTIGPFRLELFYE